MSSKQKKFAFRLDASAIVGTGHLMRCLSLADELKMAGHSSLFITRGISTTLLEMVQQKGHDMVNLPMPENSNLSRSSPYEQWLGIDWQQDAAETAAQLREHGIDHLIVDHYGIDARWEQAVRTAVKPANLPLLVLDDLANRRHDCDALIDQSLGRKSRDYLGLVPEDATLMLGVEYTALRPEFEQYRQQSLERRNPPRLQSLLISLGGTDEDNVTGQILDHLMSIGMHETFDITIVLGTLSPHAEMLREKAQQAQTKIKVLQGVSNMAQLLSAVDIAIGAGGISAWERAFLGVPSYVLLLAENQRYNVQELGNCRAALIVDKIGEMFVKTLSPDNPATIGQLAEMSKAALGMGVGEKREQVILYLTGQHHA